VIRYAREPWCVVTKTTVRPGDRQRRQLLASLLQWAPSPRRQALVHRQAGRRLAERSATSKRGVESLYGGSKNAGRNMK